MYSGREEGKEYIKKGRTEVKAECISTKGCRKGTYSENRLKEGRDDIGGERTEGYVSRKKGKKGIYEGRKERRNEGRKGVYQGREECGERKGIY